MINGFDVFISNICSSHFSFLVTFGDDLTKIQECFVIFVVYLHFAWQDGKDGQNRKENHGTKVTQNTKNQKTKIWAERNINH